MEYKNGLAKVLLRLHPAPMLVEGLLMLGWAPGAGMAPLTRAGLAQLQAAFPDERGAEQEQTDG